MSIVLCILAGITMGISVFVPDQIDKIFMLTAYIFLLGAYVTKK